MYKILFLVMSIFVLSGCFSKSDESIIKDSINVEYERLNSNDLGRIFTAWTPRENEVTFAKYLGCLESMNFNIKSVINNISKKDVAYLDKYEGIIAQKIYAEKDYKKVLADTKKEFRDKDILPNDQGYFILFEGGVQHMDNVSQYKQAVVNNLMTKLYTPFAKKHEKESRFCIEEVFEYKKPTDIAVKILKNKKQAIATITYEDGSTQKQPFQKNEKGEWERVLMMFFEE